MEVPKRILVDFGKDSQPNSREPMPAGYYDSEEESDYEEDAIPKIHIEPTARLMSPPHKLTLHEISDEEKRRIMRDTSINEGTANAVAASYLDKTPNDSVLRNMNSFQSGDPVSLARQVRHLHNRVKLIEDELQTHQNRQLFLFSVLSVYIFYKGVKWLSH